MKKNYGLCWYVRHGLPAAWSLWWRCELGLVWSLRYMWSVAWWDIDKYFAEGE